MPEFSILMPAYDYGRFVGEAIDSVLAQSFGDFELIVIDPGSADDTWEVVSGYDDPRVITIRTEWEPVSATLATALDAASGTWVTNLNADDRLRPQALASVHAHVTRDQTIGVLGVHLRTIDSDGAPFDDGISQSWVNTRRDLNDPEAWIWTNYLAGCSFIRRSSLIDVGGYGQFDTIYDWDLWIRALAAGLRFEVLPAVLMEWRRHGANVTGNQPLSTVQQYAQICRATLLPLLRTSDRTDLVARTLAGFITHEVLAQATPRVRRETLDEVVYSSSADELDEALLLVTEEVLRLREHYLNAAAVMAHSRQEVTDLTARLRDRDLEVGALADRLHSAEIDRRQAQAHLEALRRRPAYRVARKAAHLLRRRPD